MGRELPRLSHKTINPWRAGLPRHMQGGVGGGVGERTAIAYLQEEGQLPFARGQMLTAHAGPASTQTVGRGSEESCRHSPTKRASAVDWWRADARCAQGPAAAGEGVVEGWKSTWLRCWPLPLPPAPWRAGTETLLASSLLASPFHQCLFHTSLYE